MAGETVKAEAVCLAVRPWSQTSHVVVWFTPAGKVTTVVKGAVRPKSAFLGQYDLNYTCEIIYYARERGEAHALRECTPTALRERLRGSYRALALADYFRRAVEDFAPSGPDAEPWYRLLNDALDGLLESDAAGTEGVRALLAFELAVLRLSGLEPELESASGAFTLRGERRIPVSAAAARFIRDPANEKNPEILLDAARVIGVFYSFHLDCPLEARRTVLRMVLQNEQGTGKQDG